MSGTDIEPRMAGIPLSYPATRLPCHVWYYAVYRHGLCCHVLAPRSAATTVLATKGVCYALSRTEVRTAFVPDEHGASKNPRRHSLLHEP
eukprot:3934388-Rhodomonas_salina.1